MCFLNSFLCSSFSAVIEHTNRVIYLEDNDVAAVGPDGCMSACHSPFPLLPLLYCPSSPWKRIDYKNPLMYILVNLSQRWLWTHIRTIRKWLHIFNMADFTTVYKYLWMGWMYTRTLHTAHCTRSLEFTMDFEVVYVTALTFVHLQLLPFTTSNRETLLCPQREKCTRSRWNCRRLWKVREMNNPCLMQGLYGVLPCSFW